MQRFRPLPGPGLLLALVLLFVVGGGCAAPRLTGNPNDPPSADHAVQQTLTKFRGSSWISDWIDDAYGYAVFPGVLKGGAGFGGALGGGKVYERNKLVGTATTTQVTFGFQLGGQAYSGLMLFHTPEALESFKLGDLSLTAQASAVFVLWGLSIDVVFADGVTMITGGPIGLMYDASIGGMIFRYRSAQGVAGG